MEEILKTDFLPEIQKIQEEIEIFSKNKIYGEITIKFVDGKIFFLEKKIQEKIR